MIALNDVSFAYHGGASVLKHINLTIPDGQWLTILGDNGSGKSTLAMIINGLLLPKEGEVLIDGISTTDKSAEAELRKKVSIVFQNPDNQIVGATVEEDIAFGPCNMGLPREEIHKRVEEALTVTGMVSYRNHAPHMLSGGQKQKTAIAGALAMRPKHLILDEASSMLDPVAREEIWTILLKIREIYGITIVNISHFPEESFLGTGICLLKKGSLEALLWQSK